MNRDHTLVLLAHGSRAGEASTEMGRLAADLESAQPGLKVRGAFLSLGEPGLADALEGAIREGSLHIEVLPLFLFSGKHVLEDIPNLFQNLQARYPEVRLALLDPIGKHPGFARFLLDASGRA